jgi:hypothetical protein
MSLYRQGAAYGKAGGYIGATEGFDVQAQAELTAANKELQSALKAALGAFPDSFTAERAEYELGNAAGFGERMRAKYGGRLIDFARLLGVGVNTSGLDAAINAALDAARFWMRQKPLVGKGYVYKKGANKEWQQVRDQVIRVYVEAAGIAAQQVVNNQAERELRADLNPASAANLTKIIVIAGLAMAGTLYLPDLLSRMKKGAVQ